MSKMAIKTFIQKNIDKYLEKRQHLCKDFNEKKKERIKNTIYEIVIECLEICLPLSKKVRWCFFFYLMLNRTFFSLMLNST